MKRIYNYILIAVMAVYGFSCVSPEDPTPTNMSYGDWYVQEYYVDGQLQSTSSGVIQRFTLERDGTFLLTDQNDFLTVGNWTSTSSTLTLTESSEGGTVFEFAIAFQSYQKMHLVQTITSPTAGAIEIRYLMNKDSNGNTY